MAAGNANIVVEQGSDLSYTFTLKSGGSPVNLTGTSFRGMIRKSYSDVTPLATFDCVIGNAVNGIVSFTLPHLTTQSLDFKTALYDVEWVLANGDVHRVLQGNVVFSKEVTK